MFISHKKFCLFILILILVSKISYCSDIDQELKRLFSDLQNSPYSPSTSTIRKEAIAELIKIGEPAVEPLILNMNYSGQNLPTGSNVRSGIIEALGKIGDERAIEPLIEILGARMISIGNRISYQTDRNNYIDETEIDAAMNTLVMFGESAIKPLINCITSSSEQSDGRAPSRAISVLGRIGKPAQDFLINYLNQENNYYKKVIINALGDIGDPNTVELIINYLDDPNTQSNAINALKKINDSRAIEPLKTCCFSNRSRDAAAALEKLGYKPANLEEQIDFICVKRKWNELSALGEPAAEILLKRLDNNDINVRLNAATALGHMKDERAIKYLEEFYDNPDKDISAAAFSAMVEIKSKELISFFVKRLDNLDWYTRNTVPDALESLDYQPQTQEEQIKFLIAAEKWDELENIGPAAKEPLIKCLNEDDSYFCENVLNTLYEMNDINDPEPYLPCLKDKDNHVRSYAIMILERMNYKPTNNEDEIIIFLSKRHSRDEMDKLGTESVEGLIKCLKHNDDGLSSTATIYLGRIGDKRAVEPLIEYVKSHDYSNRSAISALASFKDARAFDTLIECLKSEDSNIRRDVAKGLGDINDVRAIEPLLACIENQKYPIPSEIVFALEKLGYKPSTPEMRVGFYITKNYTSYDISPFGTAAINPLIDILETRNQGDRNRAIESLIKIGEPSIEPLIWRLEENSLEICKEILTTVGRIGGDIATDYLANICLTNLRWENRQNASVALGKIGNEKAVEALITCINKELNENVRKSAAESLGDIKNDKAIDYLVICLDDPDKNVRQAAAIALDKIGYEQPNEDIQIQALISQMKWNDLATIGAPAVELLINCLKDNSYDIRQGAAESLGRIGDKRAIQPLISCLGDISPQVRGAVAQALGNIKDEQAIEPLAKYLKQEKDNVARGKFIEALMKVGDEKVASDIAGCLPDWFNRVTILFALTRFNWQPVTNEQNVYLHIAATDKVWLDNNKELVQQVLIVDANSYNAQKLEHSVYATLELGYEDLIPELVEIIRNRCNSEMAMKIRSCGNEELEKAAYMIMRRYDFMY